MRSVVEMTDKELRRLNKKGLLEILLRQAKEIDELKAGQPKKKQPAAKQETEGKTADLTASETVKKLESTVESMQKAFEDCLQEMKQQRTTHNASNEMTANVEKKGSEIIAEAEKKAAEIIASAESIYQQKMDELAARVDRLNRQVNEYYAAHPEIREYMESDRGEGA